MTEQNRPPSVDEEWLRLDALSRVAGGLDIPLDLIDPAPRGDGDSPRERTSDMTEHDLILYFEGVRTVDGRIIASSGWTAPLPLLDFRGNLIGKVVRVWRERPAVVGTVDISLVPYTGLAAEPEFDDTEVGHTNNGLLILWHGRLRAVRLGEHPCWEGMTIR